MNGDFTTINYILGTMERQVSSGSLFLEGPDEHQRALHGFGTVMQTIHKEVHEGNKVMIMGDFLLPTIMNPFITCAKTARCISWLSTLSSKAGQKILLCDHKKARTRTHILGRLGEQLGKGPALRVPSDAQDLGKVTQHWGDRVWNREWTNITGCRQSKLWFPKISKEKSRYIRQLGRENIVHWIQFLTGH